jgi:hypothetical protein
MKHVYFIRYTSIHKDGSNGFGRCSIVIPNPIQYLDQIDEIEEIIKKEHPFVSRILVDNYQLLRTEEGS